MAAPCCVLQSSQSLHLRPWACINVKALQQTIGILQMSRKDVTIKVSSEAITNSSQ
uniref:Uncharacterized protein n=1 Tax=Gorilla gorilla gorilla TaxID=9595 RepID=A0A2I2YLX6_GORGO